MSDINKEPTSQEDLLKRMEALASEMTGGQAPPPAAPPGDDAAAQDLVKRMESLASELSVPPASRPAALRDDASADMLKRMEDLASEMAPPKPALPELVLERTSTPFVPSTPAPVAAPQPAAEPAPIPVDAPSPVPAFASPSEAAPDTRALRTIAEMVRELRSGLDLLQDAFARDSKAVRELLGSLAAKEAPVPAAAPAPAAPDPALASLAQSVLELKAMVGQQLGARDQRIAELEARLAQAPGRPASAALPVGAAGLDDVADSVRDLQASMERMREAMKADLSSAITSLKYNMATQLSRMADAPRVQAPSLGAPAPLPHFESAFPASPTVDVLRQELLGPMSAMKSQLLDLTMSYHQISLRLAVLAAQEKSGGSGLLE